MERLCVWWKSSRFRRRPSIGRLGSVFLLAQKWRLSFDTFFETIEIKLFETVFNVNGKIASCFLCYFLLF